MLHAIYYTMVGKREPQSPNKHHDNDNNKGEGKFLSSTCTVVAAY